MASDHSKQQNVVGAENYPLCSRMDQYHSCKNENCLRTFLLFCKGSAHKQVIYVVITSSILGAEKSSCTCMHTYSWLEWEWSF